MSAEVIQLHSDPLDQLCDAMSTEREVILSGVAGTGKTTLVRRLKERGIDTHLLAPTGRAARRLHEVTGEEANTLHSFIFDAPTEHWMREDASECKELGRPCDGCSCSLSLAWSAKEIKVNRGTWLVIDETSMVDEALASAVRARVAELDLDLGILWVGDPAQLPPVNGRPGVDLNDPHVLLTTVHRTERQGILDLCSAIRSADSAEEMRSLLDRVARHEFGGVSIGDAGWDGAAGWRAGKSSRMLVTHQNKHRIDLNSRARTAAGFKGRLSVADRLLIRENSRAARVLNGEVVRVDELEVDSERRVAHVSASDPGDGRRLDFVVVLEVLDTLDRDLFRRNLCRWPNPWAGLHGLVHAQYGYALTCHAAQGCEAPEVGVVWTSLDDWRAERDFEDARSWLYTACTRAAQSLTIWRVRA